MGQTYGGQAVIEGVMMKGPNYYSIAVRKESGKIALKTFRFRSLAERYKLLKWPFLRGILNMYEILVIGVRSLNYSVEKATGKKDEKLGGIVAGFSLFLGFALAIAIFKFLPFFLAGLAISRDKTYLFNIIEGGIKLLIFIGYVYIISLFADVRRVFEYHGAEHKTIHCYESGKSLTVRNIKQFTTKHPRCGTSFLFLVIAISIIVYVFIPKLGFWNMFLFRLLFLVPVISLSYEILKLTHRLGENPIARIIALPGVAIQAITTKEPDAKQIEIAVAALKGLIKAEKA